MLDLQRILVPTDGGPCAAHAYAYALPLAAGAELHLVHGDVPTDKIDDDPTVPLPASPSDLRLVEATASGNSVAEALLGYAEREDVDLIVMGTHGRSGLAHLFLGSVAERVVREATCPVLTVRADRNTDTVPEAKPVRRILAPVDFSERAEVALKHAVALAERYDATVDVLHAVDVPALPDLYDVGIIAVTPDLVERSRTALAGLVEQVIPEAYRGQVVVQVDTPVAAILDVARDQDTDLIVMATHGLRGLKRFTLGSVAERVVQRAPCPVFTVKSFGKSLLTEEPEQAEEPAHKERYEAATVTLLRGQKGAPHAPDSVL